MRVAGLGFSSAATLAELRAALAAAEAAAKDVAGDPAAGPGLDALATLRAKAAAPAFATLAAERGLPVIGLAEAALAGIATPSRSPRVMARFGTGSLAEAAALAAAGRGARLIVPRIAAGRATAAIAEATEWAPADGGQAAAEAQGPAAPDGPATAQTAGRDRT